MAFGGADRGDVQSTSGGDRVHALIESFLAHSRRGPIDVQAFVAAHTECALELGGLMPALIGMEQAARAGAPSAPRERPDRIGPYDVEHEIGRGGMGVVYQARDRRDGSRVALKVLLLERRFHEADVRRFQREGELASRIGHPGICRLIEAGVEDGVPFIAMQWIDGESLAASIRRARDESRRCVTPRAVQGDGGGAIDALVAIFAKASRALAAAHEAGVLHRDVKPGNILVDAAGEPVLVDFGVARELEAASVLTRSGEVPGTPAYMAPEQIDGRADDLDARVDVYGLGASLYECLCLRRPFGAERRVELFGQILHDDLVVLAQRDPTIDRELSAIVTRALSRDRRFRQPSALALAHELERWLLRDAQGASSLARAARRRVR